MSTLSTGRLSVAILMFVLIGVPFVAYIWDTLNDLLSGVVRWPRLLLTLVALAIFLALLKWLAARVAAWEAHRPTHPRERIE